MLSKLAKFTKPRKLFQTIQLLAIPHDYGEAPHWSVAQSPEPIVAGCSLGGHGGCHAVRWMVLKALEKTQPSMAHVFFFWNLYGVCITYIYIYIYYIYGGFLKWRYPKMDGLYWTTLLKWMIWGYPYFRKPPYTYIYI